VSVEAGIIIGTVVAAAEIGAFVLGWVGGARYVLRLRRALREARQAERRAAAERDQAAAVLDRATAGTDDVIRDVRGERPHG
jgi:hypothetical protein